MRKKRRPIHIYEEGEKPMKMWLPSKPLIDLIMPKASEQNITNASIRLRTSTTKIRKMMEPDNFISFSNADKYAIRLRLPSLHDMARLV